jgi:transcriptional regulator with XRE-family HTH domain
MNDITLRPKNNMHPTDANPSWQWSTERKVQHLAEKIESRMRACGLTKKEFAVVMEVQPSIITRWLSGKHNFTVETIFDIERKLNFLIVDVSKSNKPWGIHLHLFVQSSFTRLPNLGELVGAFERLSLTPSPVSVDTQSLQKVDDSKDDSFPHESEYQLPKQVFDVIKLLSNPK